jgi:hypothetical protein
LMLFIKSIIKVRIYRIHILGLQPELPRCCRRSRSYRGETKGELIPFSLYLN